MRETLANKRYQEVVDLLQSYTFEAIMERMLDRVPNDIDKREGSIIWNALAPAAAEVTQSYAWLEASFDLVFADTATGEFLDKRVVEAGIERVPATRAVWDARFNVSVPAGMRFFLESHSIYFQSLGNSQLRAETAGEAGNVSSMKDLPLQPVETIPGLETAQLVSLLVPGAEEETDQALFARYQVRVRREAVSGNAAHYKQWAESVEGVGKAKIFPLAYGEGTVRIVITDANIEPATTRLINDVQTFIDPEEGHGEGEAPIGAKATVVSAEWKDIAISAKIVLSSGRTLEDCEREVREGVQALFRTLAFEDPFIRVSQINQILQRSPSVFDYAEVLIDGQSGNLELDEIEIPRLAEVNLYE